ncbi:MAG: hypothetical protein F8N39_18125 [Clostridiaceae bacterium]|nr:hypothetical protein [Clostridiaceae bacterium]
MYCVIQKIINKKTNPYGAAKELLAKETTWVIDGTPGRSYYYAYSDERFERPIKDAYKISIHKSYRENGKIKKKQWVICTMGYYDLIDSWPGDHVIRSELENKLSEMGLTEDELWDIVYKKLNPIEEAIIKEFEVTEEYKTKKKHDEITTIYAAKKAQFEEKYGKDKYDYCYDVFGLLRNEEYLKQLEQNYEAQQKYKSSYYENTYSNYNNYDFSSYFKTKQSTYTEEEKEYLKAIYKADALKLHPDIKKDNGEGMKFLNKLKGEWGI